jgi:pimeloyl-ACP methyl ester carboxylesterase
MNTTKRIADRITRRSGIGKIVASTMGGLAFVGVAAFAGIAVKIVTYVDPWKQKVAAAGYTERHVDVDGITLSYAEGPNNGPPLVLLHAQFLDWFSYSRVLPELAKSFHVYAIDYPGHGNTVTPTDYPMTANRIGVDLAAFIEQHIGQPVFLSGNSSGGLLAVWLAANRPELVRAMLLEDPPLYASEYPEITRTIAYRAFATSYHATRDHPKDFLLYWIRSNATFFKKNVGPGTAFFLKLAVQIYRTAHPGQPAEIGLIRNDTIRLMVRGLDRYDPRFGAAFYDGTWNNTFDHTDALKRITCPTLLLQANYTTLPDGTLMCAMNGEQGLRAASFIRNGRYVKIDAGHVVNVEKPAEFIRLVDGFFLPIASATRRSD